MKPLTKDIRIENIPAGAYFIGDPCYAFMTGNDWDEILELNGDFSKPIIDFKGRKVGGFATAFGDGCYRGASAVDGISYDFPVDSGTLGFVSLELLTPEFVIQVAGGGYNDEDGRHGVIMVFDKPWTASSWHDGTMRFGAMFINTAFNTDEDVWTTEDEC